MATISIPEPNLVVLAGEIDLHESPQVREKLGPILAEKPQRILIDLSGVAYIDSSGIAVLIDAMQRAHAYGGQLRIFGIRQNVRQIFEIAKLDQLFEIYPDKAAALNAP
jgi:anti-sigma B factor antagonist